MENKPIYLHEIVLERLPGFVLLLAGEKTEITHFQLRFPTEREFCWEEFFQWIKMRSIICAAYAERGSINWKTYRE